MKSKQTYIRRQNATRAAKARLGKGAAEGEHYKRSKGRAALSTHSIRGATVPQAAPSKAKPKGQAGWARGPR